MTGLLTGQQRLREADALLADTVDGRRASLWLGPRDFIDPTGIMRLQLGERRFEEVARSSRPKPMAKRDPVFDWKPFVSPELEAKFRREARFPLMAIDPAVPHADMTTFLEIRLMGTKTFTKVRRHDHAADALAYAFRAPKPKRRRIEVDSAAWTGRTPPAPCAGTWLCRCPHCERHRYFALAEGCPL